VQVSPSLCAPALAAQGGVQLPKGLAGACRRRLLTVCDCVEANQASDHEATKVKVRFKHLHDSMYNSICSGSEKVVFTLHFAAIA
jgi:hypothetical protein